MSLRAGILAHKIMLTLVVGVILCVLYGMAGCRGMWQSMRSVAVPAGGAAGGAALGSLAGPAGTIGGAAVGAGLASAIEQNASLRSGETQGEGSLEKEIERWAAQAPGEVAKSYLAERRARFEAKVGEGWFRKWAWRAVWLAVAYFLFLRRQWIWKVITGQGVKSRFWTFIHTLQAGNITRKLAIGDNPIEAAPIVVPAVLKPAVKPRRRVVVARRKRKAVRR